MLGINISTGSKVKKRTLSSREYFNPLREGLTSDMFSGFDYISVFQGHYNVNA